MVHFRQSSAPYRPGKPFSFESRDSRKKIAVFRALKGRGPMGGVLVYERGHFRRRQFFDFLWTLRPPDFFRSWSWVSATARVEFRLPGDFS